MSPYFFGYLFVRGAKVLAALVFLAGLTLACFAASQASLESGALRYHPNGFLGNQLQNVVRLQEEAQGIVAGFRPADGAPEAPGPETADLQAFILQPPGTPAAFEKLNAALLRVRTSDEAMKKHLLGRFETTIANIRNLLLAHAREVTPGASASAAPSPAQPSAAAPGTPPTTNGLYSMRLSPADIRERAATLDEATETLRVLVNQAEKAENKQALSSSISELDNLQALLPTPIAATPKTPTASPASVTPPGASRRTVTAELVASKLQLLANKVRQAIGASWASTEATEQAVHLAAEEEQKCRNAETALRRIWQGAVAAILTRVVGGAFLAFLLLAMTDLTKALLDSAAHSGVVADAYRAASAAAGSITADGDEASR